MVPSSAKYLTREHAAEFLKRLATLPFDARPAWGKLRADELVPHLIAAIRLSMKQIPSPPFFGNWLTRHILWPIVRTGMLPVPKNVSLRDATGRPIPAIQCPGDLDTLSAAIQEFIERREAGTLETSTHPLFGDVGPDGWAVLHVQHIKHHLKQFGI